MKKGQLTQYKIITITAVLVVLACSFAIYLRLFTEKELWYEMFAAVLGVNYNRNHHDDSASRTE